MKIRVDINHKLIQEAMQLARTRSKREVIHLSLQELIRQRRIERLLQKLGNFPLNLTYRGLEKIRKDR